MNRLNLSITSLCGTAPCTTIIPAATLAQYFDATTIVTHAQEAAQARLQQADAILAEAQREAEQIRADARQQGLAEAASERETMRAALIDETLTWLIAEEQLETAIAAQLDTRVRTWMAKMLAEWIGEQEATEWIMQRVKRRLPHGLEDTSVTLRVSTAAIPAAQAEFAAYPQVRVCADAALNARQAVLETRFVTLRVDLDVHLQSLLTYLTRETREEMLYAE
ncbi:MAG: Nodulation protein NolV [Glomeribacter sp. 1016415]|nr:Nodulation protein NolV [Glomeribacter sp. 1016415]